MNVHHDVSSLDKCRECLNDDSGFLDALTATSRHQFETISFTKEYSKNALLLVEGQPPASVFVLRSGRVKLSTCSSDGRATILGVALPGDVLGLSSTVMGLEYDTSATALEVCRADLVPGDVFVRFLQDRPDAAFAAAKHLSRDCRAAHKTICSLSHSDPVLVKLAKLFLSFSAEAGPGERATHLTNRFTHEQMAEMIGTSRETVTRSLREMRERGLVTLKGPDLIIHDHDRLRLATGTANGNGNGHAHGNGNGSTL